MNICKLLILLLLAISCNSVCFADDFLMSPSNYQDIRKMRPENHIIDKWDYIGIWCNGQVMHDMDCLTDDYAVSFYSVEGWMYGAIRAKLKARRYDDRKPAVFFFVKDTDYEYIKDAKEWAEAVKIKAFFGSTDEIIKTD